MKKKWGWFSLLLALMVMISACGGMIRKEIPQQAQKMTA